MDTLNEFNIKFGLDSPQDKNTEIEIFIDAKGEYLYKFLCGYEGKWNTLNDFSEVGSVIWMPKEYGVYTIMVQIRKVNSSKSFDYVSKAEYEIKEIEKKIQKDSAVFIDEIIMEKAKAFIKNETIRIKVSASGSTNIRYGFIVRKDGQQLEEIKYGTCNWVDFTPEFVGKFQLEVRVKDKYSNNDFDSFQVIPLEVRDYIKAEIDYILIPQKQYYVVSDEISLEAIVQNTDQVVVKYILKINGQIIEETDYVSGKKYKFIPKCSGTYSVEVLAKNIHCSNLYDSIKEVNINVFDYYPITKPSIACDKDSIKIGEPITFTAFCEGGKDVVYEFYIMENGQWKLVQNYSKKKYYMMMAFNKGSYKILVLIKSRISKLPYENYNLYVFNIE